MTHTLQARRDTSTLLEQTMRAGPTLACAAVFVALCVRLFLIADRYSVDIFFGDHWAFEDATLFQKHSWLEIFRWQYGPQRQGLGGLLLKTLEPLIHWNQRYETFGLAGVIACACLAALWLKHRLFGRIGYSDVIIPLLFFTPVQYEILLGANNPSHGPLPLLLVVLYCLAWTIANNRWKHITVLVLNLLLIYTGFALFMGFITPLLLALDFYQHRKKLVLISLAIAVVSMGSFFIGYRFDSSVECFSPQLQGDLHYFVYIVFMFSSFVKIYPTQSTVVPAILMGSGLLLIASVTAATCFLKLRREGLGSTKPLVTSVLLGYSFIFCAAAAYGRTCLGLVPASRYMTYMILAFLGLYLASLSTKCNIQRREFVCVVLFLSLLSSAWISGEEERKMSTLSQQRRTWRECYLSTHNIGQCGARSGSFIYYIQEPSDLKPKLDYLERHRLSFFYRSDASYPAGNIGEH
jgi:hypothetical protein